MSAKLAVDKFELFNLVLDAYTFGFDDPVLLTTLAEWAGSIPNEDILAFARLLAKLPGFSDDDGFEAICTLSEWRDRAKIGTL